MSNEVILGIAALISLGGFLNGWRFARMKRNPWAGKAYFGQTVEGHQLSVRQVNCIGYVQMAAAPIFFGFFTAIVLFGGVSFRG